MVQLCMIYPQKMMEILPNIFSGFIDEFYNGFIKVHVKVLI